MPRKRFAFTLVELLVVIAIIGVLIALLLPAVQQAREAARRMQCSNNLKQMALAMHNYHDTYQYFPIGTYQFDASGFYTNRAFMGWSIGILGFIEQQNLFDRYDSSNGSLSSVNQFVRESVISTYNCPSDPNAGQLFEPATGACCGRKFASSSYRGISGRSEGVNYFDDIRHIRVAKKEDGGILTALEEGGRASRFADITDGTSNTFLVGEAHATGSPERSTFWAHTFTSYALGSITVGYPAPTFGITDYSNCVAVANDQGVGVDACKRYLGSMHTGGVQFARADGSVSFTSETIDQAILGGHATASGSEVLP
ncbi:DUF1559 family PulG-like putative transporter [Blastopirellula marina]|uniref:DUF1559 domain-containing protein n=1 Tax=Blastopirellula marina DSM 3645 TaxID=314230 RepID=A3ZLS1_9BACT|nr:DUF1559 domain-containing protein [Blastopirellula marina]EAQ82704.1 hypothetical protein DSM3645_09902 [Blastopirellula marina DSM 3645]